MKPIFWTTCSTLDLPIAPGRSTDSAGTGSVATSSSLLGKAGNMENPKQQGSARTFSGFCLLLWFGGSLLTGGNLSLDLFFFFGGGRLAGSGNLLF